MRNRIIVYLSFLALSLLMAGCSAHKNTGKSRFWQSFTAKYNTYYNGSQAYIDGQLEKEQGNKDNYTELLPIFTVGNKQSRTLGKGNYDRTVEKMEKTIKQHSIKAKPEWRKTRRKTQKDIEWLSRREYNPFLWKAWLLMGQAQFQKGDFDEAAATFAYMSRLYQTQPMQNALARAWLARSYTELGWLYDAEDVMRNMSRDSIHYRAQAEWNRTFANYYLRTGEIERAVPYLRQVIKSERRKTQKAREWFIMGQVQAALGWSDAAYKSFQKVVRQNPPYELEFNARIAQSEVMANSGSKTTARKMISRLKRMARSDNNKDYLDQVYYAIGNIYLSLKDTTQAVSAYEKGNKEATRSGIEKGVLLLRLGGLYWDMEKYNDAQRCYGEAIGLLDKDRPDYEELDRRSKVLDELVPYTDAIHLQDSLQELARMPEKERLEAIDRVIEALKKKEKEERDKQLEAEVEQAQQRQGAAGNRSMPNRQQQAPPAATKDGSWYFYNAMAVNQGKQTFQKQWGKRENVDDWQRQNRTVVNLDAPAEASDGADTAALDSLGTAPDGTAPDGSAAGEDTDTLANDPHNREYYLAQIPFTEEAVEASNLVIMDGLYNSGVIFKDKLDNFGLSEKQLRRLTGQYPTFGQMDQVWYHLFLLYSRMGRHDIAAACIDSLKASFPDSEWTTLLSDPYFAENQRFGEHIEDSIYGATYQAFKNSQYDVISANARISEERFPLGLNRPKFLFIEGLSLLNQGDAQGCAEKLKTVVEKYPQSEVTELAGMIIKGVQEGRQLYGGTFDLDDIWNRRDLTLAQDSTSTDTLSVERDVPFRFIIVYQPDSVNENQLLFEMARFNFSNFLVRNFDLDIEQLAGANRMAVSGFLNYDEARQYANQLYAADAMKTLLQQCRSVIISEHNLSLIGTRYSYKDYDDFYEQHFQPLKISDEELLQIPEAVEQPDEPEADAGTDAAADGEGPDSQPAGNNAVDDFFDDLF